MLDPFDPDSFIVRAEVHILDIEPEISRTLELSITLNLAQLHEVLQAAFGWTDSHLHQFNIGGLIYGAPEFGEDGLSDSRTFEATEVRMIDLHFPYGRDESALTILYEYDFGDNWRHMLRWSASRARKVCNILAVSPANGPDLPKMLVGLQVMPTSSTPGSILSMMSTKPCGDG